MTVDRADRRDDRGFALIEILITIIILGILAAVVVLAVGNVTTKAAETGCDADKRTLQVSYEVFAVQTNTAVVPAGVPASGRAEDRFEQTLVDMGFLAELSVLYDMDENGVNTPQGGSGC